MRSRLNILVAAAVAALVVPQLAMADSVDEQLRLMNERMSQMENQLQATQDELNSSQEKVARQESVIEKAGLARESRSGLAGFYDQVQISGWLAASYAYNFSSPTSETIADQNLTGVFGTAAGGPNSGYGGAIAPFHPDHNSFSVDQLMFEIEKPVTEESRGGFRADLLWGKTASLLGAPGLNRVMVQNSFEGDCHAFPGDTSDVGALNTDECEGDSASDFNLYQAYVQYLTPFGPTLKAGKFATLVGSEQVGTVYNFNITRGIVWSLLQPIQHYGVLLDGQTDGGIVYSAGVLNSIRGIDPDSNNDKSGMFRIGYSGETFDILNTFIYGHEEYGDLSGPGNLELLTYDLVVNWNPNENFSGWVNFDYVEGWNLTGGPEHPSAWGLAMAGRYAFNDRLGFALRGEVAEDDNLFFSLGDTDGYNLLWSITGTVDYELADNLVVKAEARYDHVYCKNSLSACDEFISKNPNESNSAFSGPYTRSDQWLGLVELSYRF